MINTFAVKEPNNEKKERIKKMPIRFNSINNLTGEKEKANNKIEHFGGLNAVEEDLADLADEENKINLPNKPSYFNMFDDEMIDSEDELVAGENNYIEIDCLPMVKQARPVAVTEENKKEDSDKRSSQYKPSPREEG